jgi:hypothetical protein
MHKILIFLCFILAGCSDHVATWSEDVLLHDGKSIKVERKTLFKRNIFGQVLRSTPFSELRYEPLGLIWQNDGMQVFGFDIVNGVPWMVSYGDTSKICENLPKEAPQLKFEFFDGKKWVPTRYDAAPLNSIMQNLVAVAPYETESSEEKIYFDANRKLPRTTQFSQLNVLDYQDMKGLFCVGDHASWGRITHAEKETFYKSRDARRDQLLEQIRGKKNGN